MAATAAQDDEHRRTSVSKAFLLRGLVVALILYSGPAAARIDAQTLGDFILANQAGRPEGNQREFPSRLCSLVSADPRANVWMFTNPIDGEAATLQVWNALRVPFTYMTDDYGTGQVTRFGAIVVGYELNTANSAAPDDGRRLSATAGDACSLGPTIVLMAPVQIIQVGINDQLAGVTQIDPSPEYHWWHLLRQTLQVRFVQRIPVTYLVNSMMVPGHVVVAFSH
jgi:hypothetical protein